jgi:hypothetical protein
MEDKGAKICLLGLARIVESFHLEGEPSKSIEKAAGKRHRPVFNA